MRPANRTGYVWGVDPERGEGGHTWLTVPGSHWQPPALAAIPGEAARTAPYSNVLALVEEVPMGSVSGGVGYRVLELAGEIA